MSTERRLRRALDRIEDGLAVNPVDSPACKSGLRDARESLEVLLAERTPRCVRPAHEWCDALRKQAVEDLAAAKVLAKSGGPLSVLAMLLQMVFEKVAKAAVARTEKRSLAAHLRTHTSASHMVVQIRNNAKYAPLKTDWRAVLPLVEALERAHPAVSPQGRHLEYPWEDEAGVYVPGELPSVIELGDPMRPRAPQLLHFASELLERFDEIFE